MGDGACPDLTTDKPWGSCTKACRLSCWWPGRGRGGTSTPLGTVHLDLVETKAVGSRLSFAEEPEWLSLLEMPLEAVMPVWKLCVPKHCQFLWTPSTSPISSLQLSCFRKTEGKKLPAFCPELARQAIAREGRGVCSYKDLGTVERKKHWWIPHCSPSTLGSTREELHCACPHGKTVFPCVSTSALGT